MPLEIVPRGKWKARGPQRAKEMNRPIGNVVVWYIRNLEFCEKDEECEKAVLEQQRRDLEKGMADIKYNFLICGNGKVYEGRGWDYQPSQRLPYSELRGNRLDIAHIGEYVFKGDLPFAMQDAQNKLIEYGVDNGFIGEQHKIIDKEH